MPLRLWPGACMYSVPSPEELREWIRDHELTVARAGALVGVDARAARRWTAPDTQAGHRAMPWAAWALLRLMVGAATIDEVKAEALTP